MVAKKNPKRSLINRVQRRANLYARLRDTRETGGAACISCGVYKLFDELDGGHFIATTSAAVRFDERNINAQCLRCNRFLHSNARGYYKGMLAKYGPDITADLEAQEFVTKKWSEQELLELDQYYKERLEELK